MTKFFTKQGWLTDYAMACGYIHKAVSPVTTRTVILTRLSCDSPAYRVEEYANGYLRAYDHVFGSIKDARKAYQASMVKLQYRFESNSDVNRSVIL